MKIGMTHIDACNGMHGLVSNKQFCKGQGC